MNVHRTYVFKQIIVKYLYQKFQIVRDVTFVVGWVLSDVSKQCCAFLLGLLLVHWRWKQRFLSEKSWTTHPLTQWATRCSAEYIKFGFVALRRSEFTFLRIWNLGLSAAVNVAGKCEACLSQGVLSRRNHFIKNNLRTNLYKLWKRITSFALVNRGSA